MKKLKITMPSPCHENWDSMTPDQKGRFCLQCKKTVIDFTKATDRQIAEAFDLTPQLCGRFLTTQLDRDLVITPTKKRSYWLVSLVLGVISVSNFKVQAQDGIPKTYITDSKKGMENHRIGDTIVKKVVRGVVNDPNGPLAGATVKIKGTEVITHTNFAGEYCIEVSEGDYLIFSHLGLQQISKLVGPSAVVNCTLLETEELKKMLFQVGGALGKRKRFMERTLDKIGNLFRRKQ